MKRKLTNLDRGIYIDQIYSTLGQCLLFELENEKERGVVTQKISTNKNQHIFMETPISKTSKRSSASSQNNNKRFDIFEKNKISED